MKITGQFDWGTFPPPAKIKLSMNAVITARRLFGKWTGILRGYTNPQRAVATAIANKTQVPEYEHIILESALCSFLYVKHVLKRPWPAAESIIKSNPDVHARYCNFLRIYYIKARAIRALKQLIRHLTLGLVFRGN